MAEKKLSREALARLEVGHTEISSAMARLLSIFFLLAVFLVPLCQYWLDNRDDGGAQFFSGFDVTWSDGQDLIGQVNRVNTSILEGLDLFETDLEERSVLRKLFLPPLQYFFLQYLGAGNDRVVVGGDGWLFYRPGIDSLVGQPFLAQEQLQLRKDAHELWQSPVQPDPLPAIVDFRDQLAKRDIGLLILPIPIKPSLNPQKLSSRSYGRAPVNRSWPQFLDALASSGVEVLDPRPLLEEYTGAHGSAFLQRDTHWLPGAMEGVAALVADSILQRGGIHGGTEVFQLEKQEQTAPGDISKMLSLPEGRRVFTPQTVELNVVVNGNGEFWQPESDAQVLLLGDSFTNIYSVPALGWGRGAGFAEHISYGLGQPIDLLARNDSGAYITREMLAAELARGRDRLAGKKLVIWQFAERELALGNWKMIELSLGAPPDSSEFSEFYVVDPGEAKRLRGMVASISRSPRPGSVPYRDNIITMHLIDVQADGQKLDSDQLIVYGFGMRDNSLTPLAAIRPGDVVSLEVSSWDEVQADYGSYRRSPLDDEMLELELPNWGTLDNEKNND